MTTQVKVCGVCSAEDALEAVHCGITLLGVNFVPTSPRCISVAQARVISRAVAGRVELVGVVANLSRLQLEQLRLEAELDALQLHGDEAPELLSSLSINDYKAVRVATSSDVARALQYPGERLLVDAKVPGLLGGSGHTFDWHLVVSLARKRRLILAGGLSPTNVQEAVKLVQPWAVDVASGVEVRPGRKDPALIRAFVRNVMDQEGQP